MYYLLILREIQNISLGFENLVNRNVTDIILYLRGEEKLIGQPPYPS